MAGVPVGGTVPVGVAVGLWVGDGEGVSDGVGLGELVDGVSTTISPCILVMWMLHQK